LALLHRHARPIIIDDYGEHAAGMIAGDANLIAMPAGIADEIAEAALEALRADLDDGIAGEGERHLMAGEAAGIADLAEQHRDVSRQRVLAAVAAGEGEIALEHAVHVVDIALQGVDIGRVANERELQTRSEEHTSELQSRENLVCRLLLE